MALITRTIMETPRWLYAHDEYEQARVNIRKMSIFSGIEISDETFDKFEFDMVSCFARRFFWLSGISLQNTVA